MKDLFKREPALFLTVLSALLLLAVGFGLRISGVQIDLVMNLATAISTVLTGIAIRSRVSPKQDVITALEMPPDSTIHDLKVQIKEDQQKESDQTL